MAASETVRVIVRCRPMNQRELDLKCQTIVSINTQINLVALENIEQKNEPPKQFTFDGVYPEDSITENLYAESVFPLVESVLEGYNATVFAYGQTGCGKSFTMQGINTPGSPQRGVIPRSFEHIFEASAVTTGTKYLIRASYLEIYNESIRDLLGKDVKAALDLKEYVDKGVQVQNLTWHQCSSVVDCERLMDKGNRNRATGATLMNKDSSRSHSIFTVITEMCTRSELDGKEHIRAGKLNLVDLAGSERQSKTHAEGDRLREATRINLSLSALGNVISALVDGRSKHIPYRDSKLTRLLQDSLGGNTKTLMIAAISPAHDNYDETLSTLRYANRAKNIKNKPRINEDPRDAQMKLLQDEINRLKQELLNAGNPPVPPNQVIPPPPDTTTSQTDRDDELEKERERLRAEFEREMSEIRRQCEAERLTKEEIQRKYDDLKNHYDTELEALATTGSTNQNKEDNPPAPPVPPTPTATPTPATNERNKGKKKGGNPKQKREDGGGNSDQENDGENASTGGDPTDQKRKLERLQELENKLVGGEEANNEERKKKRKKKLIDMKEKQEKRKRFHTAVNADDDDTLLKVFDNVQEQLHYNNKRLEEERTENKRLQNDNEDLQHEFQREREGYLTTIREQEKKLLLYRTMIDKMSLLIPRSSNYSNVDRIIAQARYDEDKNIYHLPDPTREEIQLPQMGNLPGTTNRSMKQNGFTSSSKSNSLSTTKPNPVSKTKPHSVSTPNEYEDDFIVPDQSPTANYEDMEKSYEQYPDDMEKSYEQHPDDTEKSFERHPDDTERGYERHPNDTERGYERNPNDTERGYERHPNGTERGYERHPNGAGRGYERHPNGTGRGYERHPNGTGRGYEQHPNGTERSYEGHSNDTERSYEGHPNDTERSYEGHPNDTERSYEGHQDDTEKHFERYNVDTEKRNERYYDDINKRYDQYHELAEKPRIKRQEHLLNENLLLQRGKRPLQMSNNDNDYMNRRLNPYDAPARLSRKYGLSSDKQ